MYPDGGQLLYVNQKLEELYNKSKDNNLSLEELIKLEGEAISQMSLFIDNTRPMAVHGALLIKLKSMGLIKGD